jgi:urease accessory protein
MLKLTHVTEPRDEPYGVLVLSYAQRQAHALCARLKSSEEAELALPRETVLHAGDFVRSEDGKTVRIVAATEDVLRADFANPLALARAAYALGARHVAVQVEDGWLLALPDAATRALLEAFDARVRPEHAPFEPERRL